MGKRYIMWNPFKKQLRYIKKPPKPNNTQHKLYKKYIVLENALYGLKNTLYYAQNDASIQKAIKGIRI